MDSRKTLRIPNDFAFVLRTAGANMRDNEFRISYAIAVGGVHTIVLIAHTDCGMARLDSASRQFIMVWNGGMGAARADEAFRRESAPKFGIRDEVDFVLREAERLREIYPRIPSCHCSIASRTTCFINFDDASRSQSLDDVLRHHSSLDVVLLECAG